MEVIEVTQSQLSFPTLWLTLVDGAKRLESRGFMHASHGEMSSRWMTPVPGCSARSSPSARSA